MTVRTALVTGHAGFLGREFTRQLRAAGWVVTGVDSFLANLDAAIDDCYAGDCRDYFLAYPKRYDLIVHCAAVVGGRAAIESAAWPLEMSVNLEIDAAMFRFAAYTHAGRVIYLSSSAVYPLALQDGSHGPLAEADADPADPKLPDQLYGWAKLTGEMLAGRARLAGVPVTVVRPFSGYGTSQDPTYPFGAFIDRALDRADPFEIWGNGYQVRDWIHVTDLVAAALILADAGEPGPANLGAGQAVSMHQLARMVCQLADYKPVFLTEPGRPKGVDYRVADVSLMRRFYDPKTSLQQGITDALRWRRGRPGTVTVEPAGELL